MVNPFRKAVEKLYEDSCKVYELRSAKDEATGITEGDSWIMKHEDIACKLSYKDVTSAESTEPISKIEKAIKLFVSPDLVIKPGSKIEVMHKGETSTYQNSGIPSVYSNHQEIALEAYKAST